VPALTKLAPPVKIGGLEVVAKVTLGATVGRTSVVVSGVFDGTKLVGAGPVTVGVSVCDGINWLKLAV